MQYNTVGDGNEEIVTVFDPSYSRPQAMHSSHPGYTEVIEALEAGETPPESAFDPAERAREAFEALGDRVTVSGGQVFLDGDPVDNSCTKAILRFLEEGVDDWVPLVNFFEKVQGNPSESSREQLYSFLAANEYTLTVEGDIVGYKAVREIDDGLFESINAGNPGDVQVNGIDAPARPVQRVGDVVTMARSSVNPDEMAHCSVGLHVAAWAYVENGPLRSRTSAFLRVIVSPTDVVSVPLDHSAQKMRVCRYVIDAVIDEPEERGLFVGAGEIEATTEDRHPIETDVIGVRFRRTGKLLQQYEDKPYLNPYSLRRGVLNVASNGPFDEATLEPREVVELV